MGDDHYRFSDIREADSFFTHELIKQAALNVVNILDSLPKESVFMVEKNPTIIPKSFVHGIFGAGIIGFNAEQEGFQELGVIQQTKVKIKYSPSFLAQGTGGGIAKFTDFIAAAGKGGLKSAPFLRHISGGDRPPADAQFIFAEHHSPANHHARGNTDTLDQFHEPLHPLQGRRVTLSPKETRKAGGVGVKAGILRRRLDLATVNRKIAENDDNWGKGVWPA